MNAPDDNPDRAQPRVASAARLWLIAFVVVILSAGMILYQQSKALRNLNLPELTEMEQKGAGIFATWCVSCHGEHATGSYDGPTLIHRYYEPHLHGDSTFYDAIRHGTLSHHWKYGDMPPVGDMHETDIAAIVAYVRRLQRANGIR